MFFLSRVEISEPFNEEPSFENQLNFFDRNLAKKIGQIFGRFYEYFFERWCC